MNGDESSCVLPCVLFDAKCADYTDAHVGSRLARAGQNDGIHVSKGASPAHPRGPEREAGARRAGAVKTAARPRDGGTGRRRWTTNR